MKEEKKDLAAEEESEKKSSTVTIVAIIVSSGLAVLAGFFIWVFWERINPCKKKDQTPSNSKVTFDPDTSARQPIAVKTK